MAPQDEPIRNYLFTNQLVARKPPRLSPRIQAEYKIQVSKEIYYLLKRG
jgi:hypothetical protein